MNRPEKSKPHTHASGFTLVVVLVVAAALLIAAIGSLAVSGIERGTSRASVDHQRAELAARAGLEELRGISKLHFGTGTSSASKQHGIVTLYVSGVAD
jgi:Tfp pilus assembly protein PilX